MTLRHEHTILALVVLFFAAACGSHEDSDENAQSSDAGPDAAADSGDGDGKPTAGRGGSGGRGGSTASARSGAGGSSGRGGASAAAGAGGSGGAGGAAGRSGRAGRGGSSGEGGKGGAPAEAGKGGAPAAGAPAAGAPAAGAPAAGAPAAGAPAAGAPAAGAGGTGGAAGTTVDDDDAGVPEVPPPPPGPFYSSGTIQGHFWVSQSGVGTTLTTTGYDNVPVATAPVCIQGSVVATPDYNSNANLGINLNQLMNMVPAAFTPTLAGLQLEVTNRLTSPLRIQIQAADGSASWCAIVNGAGGFIPWADFNTACWDGSGTAYALQPLATANLQVPGGTTAAIPYDVCLNRLAETAAPVGPPPPPVAGAPAPPPPPAAGAPAPPPG